MTLSLKYQVKWSELARQRRRARLVGRIVLVGFIPVVVAAGCDGAVTNSPPARPLATHSSPLPPRIPEPPPLRPPVTEPSMKPSLQRAEVGLSDLGSYIAGVDVNCVPGVRVSSCAGSLTSAELDLRQLAPAKLPPPIVNDLHQLLSDLISVDASHPEIRAVDNEWQKVLRAIVNQADFSRGFPGRA